MDHTGYGLPTAMCLNTDCLARGWTLGALELGRSLGGLGGLGKGRQAG